MTGVVFDFGNVLYHVDFPRMAQRIAGPRGEALLQRFRGSPLQLAYECGRAQLSDLLQELATAGYPLTREEFLEAFLDIFQPVAGMAELIACLARQRPLGLLSNTSPEHAQLFIETVPEITYIPHRVYSYQVGCMKPDPRTYLEVARCMGLPPEELVFTDDIPDLAAAAGAVGMHGIAFRTAADLARQLTTLGFSEAASCHA